ncbi:hypothetical protein BJF84_13460 [Rhodococcus sp. CUA-806]|nr:hypothetical protein BJF84_13460 [Rhodococcus sp. CUA-806]
MNDEPGVNRPYGIDQPKPLPPIKRYDVTHHHWNTSGLAQGLRVIGYGFMAIAVSVLISVCIVVTYLNGQT